MTQDHPRVRASLTCPVCEQAKDYGLVVCWPCYRNHLKRRIWQHWRMEMRYGNQAIETLLDKTERLLEIDEKRFTP